MKLIIDTDAATLELEEKGVRRELRLYSDEALRLLGEQWLKVGWSQRYSYAFSWLGRPLIQLPDDMLRLQELIYSIKPDVVIEVGIAHGGSLVFYASLCHLIGHGRVVGVDIEIRPHNRAALEKHPLAKYITLIEGDSVDPAIVAQAQSCVKPGDTTLVLLDSEHDKAHVLAELEAYAPLVSPGSFIVAMDGIMRDLGDVPGAAADWAWNNPGEAAAEFVRQNPDRFALEDPQPLFNESRSAYQASYWSGGFIKCLK